MAKKIPYGVSNFVSVMQQHMYYADKTMFLPQLEAVGNFLFLIRPRRFGKSLFLSMLSAYYDQYMTSRFQELFGSLYIAKNPTENQGKFQVLELDFSKATSSYENLEENVNQYLLGALRSFVRKYGEFYSEEVKTEVHSATGYGLALDSIFREANLKGYRLYLILDEYDNFTNNVLNEKGHDVYHALTHATGLYREVFKKFKGSFERIMMMGVSPVTMDDVTSGFNIGINISVDSRFNDLLGFSTIEVRTMLQYYHGEGLLDGSVDEILGEMKPWYDNYCFAEDCIDQPRVFNSDMVLNYLRIRLEQGKSPKDMVDMNTRTDYAKMSKLLDWDHMDGNRRGVIKQIAQEGEIVTDLVEMFPAYEIVRPEVFPSLLYYYGMLTIVRKYRTKLVLGIPNNNVRIQYYDYLVRMFSEKNPIDLSRLSDALLDMAYDGAWKPALQYIAESYANNSSVRDQIEGERNIQGFFAAMFSLNKCYLVAPELELNHRFCDFFLMPDHQRYADVAHSYIIELKYLSAKDFDVKAEEQWQEGVTQVHQYAQGNRLRVFQDGTELHCIVVQFKGWEMARCEEV